MALKYFALLCFGAALSSPCFAEDKAPVFPQACQENCITHFGSILGTTDDGVEAYSNCQPKCVYENPSMVEKVFAGIQWQCVEFARRWLMSRKGLTYPSIDVAADLWNKIDHLVNLKTQEKVPLRNVLNGSSELPKRGDLLIYGREYLDTGHVAIVLKADKAKKMVYVGEENYKNEKWPGKYARAISFVMKGKAVWLLDPYLIGWKTLK